MKIKIFFVPLIIFITVFLYISFSCLVFNEINFDSMNLLFWKYGALKGYIPYKDFFYPYGIFQYYLRVNVLADLLFAGLFTIIFFVILLYLNFIFKYIFYKAVSISFFIFFIFWNTGIEFFVRYGTLLVFGLLIVHLLVIKERKKYYDLLIGILTGIAFSLFLDQGAYAILIYMVIALGIVYAEIKKTQLILAIKHGLGYGLFYLIGLTIGVLPIIVYFYTTNSIHGLVQNYQILSEISQFAKVPFFPSLKTPEGLFVTVSLILSIVVLLIEKKKNTFNTKGKMLLGLTLVLLVLQYKNITRPIPGQLTFISFLILIGCLQIMLAKDKSNELLKKAFFVLVLLSVTFGYGFSKPIFFHVEYGRKYFFDKGVACYERNVPDAYKKFDAVQKNVSGNIFSYPSNSLLYPFLNQKLPYFLTIYEATSDTAQRKMIEYIKDNNVRTVVMDASSTSIQDGVPDVVRGNTILSYILKNFTIKSHEYNYFFLGRKAQGEDFFTDFPKDTTTQELLNTYLQFSLGAIPLSEGKYKGDFFEEDLSSHIAIKGNVDELNKYLRENSIVGNTYMIVIDRTMKNDGEGELHLKSGNLTTSLGFITKKNQRRYIFNLSRLPLFFADRKLTAVEFDENALFWLVKTPRDSTFW